MEAGEEWHPGKWLTMKLVVIGAEKALAGRFARCGYKRISVVTDLTHQTVEQGV